jgi:hypothetical protein
MKQKNSVSLTSELSTPMDAIPGSFAVVLRSCFDQSAMSQQAFAEVLSLELGRNVSQVNISNWLKGVEPRITPGNENLHALILEAADRIASNESLGGRTKYADPKTVAARLAGWRAAGLTEKQIQLAAELSVSLYRLWASGKVRILSVRWELAAAKVDLWQNYIAENQEAWKAKAAQPKNR